ncbi:malonyl-CoA synthase [Sphingomonas sp. ST-64]|uniref:Malonyl-CoA synthase n=1 Tax=Sphingomonas plantiphila TaxID=3163295 RepID=A0ABW8YRS5_9SPHN
MANLYARLAACFPADDAKFAVLPEGAVVTYGELDDRTARFSNQLRALGVQIGDRVAVQTEKSLDMVVLYLATVRAGAVFLPLNTAYTASELGYFLNDAEPALFVCDPARLEELRTVAAAAGVRAIETLDDAGNGSFGRKAGAQPDRFATVARDDGDLAAILYTSGTTGRSKGAMISHDNLASNAFTLVDAWRFTRDDVLLHALPIFHTHGLFVAINTVIAAGASMRFLPRFDAASVIAQLPGATVMMGVPTFYTRLLDSPLLDRDLTSHMRLFISGSAPLSADVHRAFLERTGHAILERYGMTETNMITSNPYDGARRAGTVGHALPGVSVRIVDLETGIALSDGDIGMIEVAGPNVFSGYWQQPERRATDFRNGYFITGDLGVVDDQGYVAIVGRDKDLIITGGFNVYPAEIEALLDALPEVRESAVIGAPHPDLGEGVVAVVVLESPGTADAASLLGAIQDKLARFKQPRRLVLVDALPRNAMAKIQKAQLRAEYRDIFANA